MRTPFKIALIALLVAQAYAPVWAAEEPNIQSQELENITVTTTRKEQKLGEERVKRKELDEKMIQDEYDLVRYDTGVTVVEGGRAGSNGFAIRGVDKDRVAINVDGLAQAESRSSEAFQELFGAYGNYNANRNTSEIENFSEVTVSKGADSLKSGSGALGGAVNYKTKSPSDYLKGNKSYYLGAKTGYVGRNSQTFSSITLAGKLLGFDALIVHTRRKGKETKNRTDNILSEDKIKDDGTGVFDPTRGHNGFYGGVGVARNKPDPQTWIGESTLIKGGYHITDNNYISTAFEDSRLDRKTEELSNLWTADWQGKPGIDSRNRHDVSYRRRVGFEYNNELEKGPWDSLKLRWDKQKIDMATWTWDMPIDENRIGINAQVYHTYRNIRQTTQQAGAEAEKDMQFDKLDWLTQYGLGWGKYSNDNSNHTYFVKLYDSSMKTTNDGTSVFLIKSQSKNRYAYWNNIMRFGNDRQFKLSAGIRYDRSSSRATDDPTYPESIQKQLPELGSTISHGGASYSVGFDWRFHPNFSLLTKVGTGFRAPTTDETWLLFPHPDFYLRANPKLKSEHAKNFELGLAGGGAAGSFKLSGFYTKYKDFIELTYLGGSGPEGSGREAYFSDGSYLIGAPLWQNQNRSSAYVKGIELSSNWNLDSIGLPKGMYTGLTATYTKGRSKLDSSKALNLGIKETPINALAPWSAVWNLGYDSPSKKWGAALHVSHTARKKASDTFHNNDDVGSPWPFVQHSKSYTLLDMSAYRNFGKHVTLRASANNLTNKKYHSWDALRSIREFGTVNRVDRTTHAGIDRFTSPGRNFNFTLEVKF